MNWTNYFRLLVTMAAGILAPALWVAVGVSIQRELDTAFFWSLCLASICTGIPLATAFVHLVEADRLSQKRERPKNWRLVQGGLSTNGDDAA